MERRGFVKRGIAGAIAVAGAGAPFALIQLMAPAPPRPERNYLRPPGALRDKIEFAAACIGCGLCGEVCPPECILFHKSDDGASNIPYIDPEDKACILCGKCMPVCPTAALTETPILDIDMGIARIDRTACYPWVDRGVCGACATICPLGERAISFEFANVYRPVINTGCVGCGICVEVCPHPSKPIWVIARNRDAKYQQGV